MEVSGNNGFDLQTERVGKSTIYLREKTGHKWVKYKINVNVKPYEKNLTLTKGEYLRSWSNENYSYISENPNIATFTDFSRKIYSHRKKFDAIYGKNPGTTKIKVVHYKYGLQQIWNVKVLPQPQPKELKCETTIGNECSFTIPNSEYKLETNIEKNVLDINVSSSKFELRSQKSGTAIVYLKAKYGDYYTHKLIITFKPKPPKIYTCITPVGLNGCESFKQNKYDDYSFKVSNPGMMMKIYSSVT